jgi:magnesium transporter
MDTWSFVDGRWQRGDSPAAAARWFNLVGPGDGALEELARRYGLHHLAVEDCVSPLLHAPKIDDFGAYLFVVIQTLMPDDDGPRPEELDAFVGPDFLITYQDRLVPATATVAAALESGIAGRPGADGLFYEVADRAVDEILPHVNAMAERLEQLQDEALLRTGAGETHQAVLAARARAGQVRRLLTPQMAVMQRLSRGEFPAIAEANRIYFRDVYDHLVRIDLALEGIREDAEVALGTYLSAINNRLSEVMKVLSVVSALALPAVVIAGIFGTNFDSVPGLHSNWGFATMIAAMAGLAGGMALFFRRRGWF